MYKTKGFSFCTDAEGRWLRLGSGGYANAYRGTFQEPGRELRQVAIQVLRTRVAPTSTQQALKEEQVSRALLCFRVIF